MWGALARQIAAYALTRRGKKLLAFIGTMLLCFVTAILLDLQMYISAALSGVLAAISEGKQSKAIAWELGISVRTVDLHRSNILAKLSARNTSQAVAIAKAGGFVGDEGEAGSAAPER